MLEPLFIINKPFLPAFIILFFVAFCLLFYKWSNERKYQLKLACLENFALVWSGISIRSRLFFKIMLALAWSFLFLLALRIAWGEEQVSVEQEGRHLLFALDISRSMLAEDVSPSRLEMGKIKILELVEALGPERLGLVLFAQAPLLYCPFTRDVSAFKSFLSQVDSSVIASGQTMLDKAILKAVEIFARDIGIQEKVLIFFTDGEDFSVGTKAALEKAAQAGIKVLFFGLGTPQGAPIPIINRQGQATGVEMDASGKIVLTKLDTTKIKPIVDRHGGLYLLATYAQADILQAQKFIHGLGKDKFEDRSIAVKKEKSFVFAGLAYACFILGLMV